MSAVEISKEQSVEELLKETLNQHFEIVLYNDDVNTFDHVIDCLMNYCEHSMIQAEQCAYIVHYKGKCSVKKGSKEKLIPIAEALLNQHLRAKIE